MSLSVPVNQYILVSAKEVVYAIEKDTYLLYFNVPHFSGRYGAKHCPE